jgi:hypothetical protein
MTDAEIRTLILDALQRGRREWQYENVRSVLAERFLSENLGFFGEQEQVQVKRVLWDLAVERIVSWGTESNSDAGWPFFYVTPIGREYLAQTGPHFLAPDGYISYLRNLVPDVDEVVLQYVYEATRAFRAQLWFAAAVMLGAASERSVLNLLEAIIDHAAESKEKERLKKLLTQPRLGEIFKAIETAVTAEVKSGALAYSVHQGSTEHLLSLAEIIRVQRNEAVHPHAGTVDRQKIFLALQGFPVALEVLERVRRWFRS